MSIVTDFEPGARTVVIGLDRLIYRLSRHWILAFSLLFGLYVEGRLKPKVALGQRWRWDLPK